MLRVTADSNIFISALAFEGGNPSRLLEMARSGVIELVVSDAILDEVGTVLRRKFHWTNEDIADSKRLIPSFCQHVTPKQKIDIVDQDPADNRILECAASGQSDFLVSGDSDLLCLKQFGAIRIVKVAEFLVVGQFEGGRIARKPFEQSGRYA